MRVGGTGVDVEGSDVGTKVGTIAVDLDAVVAQPLSNNTARMTPIPWTDISLFTSWPLPLQSTVRIPTIWHKPSDTSYVCRGRARAGVRASARAAGCRLPCTYLAASLNSTLNKPEDPTALARTPAPARRPAATRQPPMSPQRTSARRATPLPIASRTGSAPRGHYTARRCPAVLPCGVRSTASLYLRGGCRPSCPRRGPHRAAAAKRGAPSAGTLGSPSTRDAPEHRGHGLLSASPAASQAVMPPSRSYTSV